LTLGILEQDRRVRIGEGVEAPGIAAKNRADQFV
jgi:hypothetical protein